MCLHLKDNEATFDVSAQPAATWASVRPDKPARARAGAHPARGHARERRTFRHAGSVRLAQPLRPSTFVAALWLPPCRTLPWTRFPAKAVVVAARFRAVLALLVQMHTSLVPGCPGQSLAPQ